MNKNGLKKLVVKENTIAAAKKQVQQQVKYWGQDTQIYIRCYSSCDYEFTTSLYIELSNGDDWATIELASITIEDIQYLDFYKFEEITWEIFKTMKDNMIKELKKYNYKIAGTQDYHC